MACIKPVTRNIFISPNTLNTNTIIIISELLTEGIRCVFAPFPIEHARGLLCPIGWVYIRRVAMIPSRISST